MQDPDPATRFDGSRLLPRGLPAPDVTLDVLPPMSIDPTVPEQVRFWALTTAMTRWPGFTARDIVRTADMFAGFVLDTAGTDGVVPVVES